MSAYDRLERLGEVEAKLVQAQALVRRQDDRIAGLLTLLDKAKTDAYIRPVTPWAATDATPWADLLALRQQLSAER